MTWRAPRTLEEALAIRAEHRARPFAGGTDIFPERAARRGWGDGGEEAHLDLSRLPGLREITRDGDAWRIGCLVTWTDLLRASLPPLFDGYRLAAREIGGAQIQNRGTLVGNLCTASPAGDGTPCLLSLDAEVELASLAGVRRVPVHEFIVGRRRTLCRDDEIVTALIVPARDGARSGFRKLGARRYLVISIVMAAAAVETTPSGRISRARIAIGACSEAAQRLRTLEAAIVGNILEPAIADLVEDVHVQHLQPVDDVRASSLYRRAAAREVASDLLLSLALPRAAEAA